MTDIEQEKIQAETLRKYWAERGYLILTWMETAQVKGEFVHCIKSDLVNGLPRGFRHSIKALKALKAA